MPHNPQKRRENANAARCPAWIRLLWKRGIQPRIPVEGVLSGRHASRRKGSGIEWLAIRKYTAGDDFRTIDWNVTARFAEPYVRDTTEERDHRYFIVVDRSASGTFGTEREKQETMLELAAGLILAATQYGDRIGLCLFTNRIESFIPARKGRRHGARLVSALYGHEPQSRGTDLAVPLRFFRERIRPRSTIILISDFDSSDFARALESSAGRHDMIAFETTDPREHTLSDAGLVVLEDPETGEQVLADTGDAAFRQRYEEIATQQQSALDALFASACIRHARLQDAETACTLSRQSGRQTQPFRRGR